VKYLATLFDARLDVVHIIPEGHTMSPEETSIGNFVERSLENSPHKTHVVTESNAGKGLLHFIDQHQVDLVIIEPRKHSFFHKLFSGSTTSEVLFNSPVPVLTIHGEE
jgi:nucleotide-binding universal stress UspA family protein